MTPALPVSPIDPFADDFLAAPYPFHAELRDAGPFVWLERYGIWACTRHTEV
jgi:4-methoxybenzoate monooxygenase (O-demethylating)